MTQRMNYTTAAPDGFGAMRRLQGYVDHSGLEHSLLELVKMRASQMGAPTASTYTAKTLAPPVKPSSDCTF